MKQVFVTGGSGFVGQNLIPMLVEQGYAVKALARSAQSAKKVEALGATVVQGDMSDAQALAVGVEGCATVFHLAASVDFFASEKELKKLHVEATALLLNTAKKAGVRKFVYLSAASVIMNGKPIENADETFVSDNIVDGYSKTKLQAEKLVLQANSQRFQTVAIRPPLIWGKGDPNVLPALVKAIEKGQLQFIGGGTHRFDTCNVINVCQALILADRSEQSGKAYFITDGEPHVFKDFIKQYVGTKGVQAPDKAISLSMAKRLASVMEFVWKTFRLKGAPPIYKGMVNTLGLAFILNDAKARKELQYKTVVSVEKGLHLMRN